MKAVLEEKENHVPKIHNIITLKGKIENYINLNIDQEILDQINELYIDSRYPADLGLLPDGKPSKETAFKFYELARQIHEKTGTFLSD